MVKDQKNERKKERKRNKGKKEMKREETSAVKVREADDGNNETEKGKGFMPTVNSYTCHDANISKPLKSSNQPKL